METTTYARVENPRTGRIETVRLVTHGRTVVIHWSDRTEVKRTH